MRLADFTGTWTLIREIEDRRIGTDGTLSGQVTIRGTATDCTYDETGLLRLGSAQPLTATRRYIWVEPGPETIEVRFADGRFFHRIDLRHPAAQAAHACAPDRYAVRYDFTAWPLWRSEWHVRGPHKNYRMTSAYRPAGQARGTAASRRETV